ncbi:hypothetical protein [Flectobacillus major]|uniref:hypothetical protein n=1 Tax=Flectobacillus major TaxID=103 RepID=UPI0004062A20|nr:hypothetical protein [Flectobacillus major]
MKEYMKIGYAQLGGVGEEFSSLLNSLADKTNLIFKDKFYGEDLYEIHIGVICVAPEFELFFKRRRPRYQKEQKEYVKDGVKYVLLKNFEYDLKLDYSLYKSLNGNELKEKMFSEILDSFQILKSTEIIKKIKHFDRDSFFKDLEQLRNL